MPRHASQEQHAAGDDDPATAQQKQSGRADKPTESGAQWRTARTAPPQTADDQRRDHQAHQCVRRRPTLTVVARAASVGDILVVALLVASQGGLLSDLYIFFFPALLAISVAFSTRVTAVLTALAIALYSLLAGMSVGYGAEVLLLRVAVFAGVAVVGNAYWRLHHEQIHPGGSLRLEAAENLFFGQVTLMWARWFAIGTAAMVVLIRAHTTSELVAGIAPVLVLLVVNFFAHGRYAMERPISRTLTVFASALDLAVFAAIFLSWPDAHALPDPFVVLLYPTIFAFALVFAPRLSTTFTLSAILLYAALCLATGADLSNADQLKVLVLRFITLAATGGLGMWYWRLVRRGLRDDARQVHQSEAVHAMAT